MRSSTESGGIVGGDVGSFRRWIERTAYSLSRGTSREVKEDIVQAGFLGVVAAMKRWDPERSHGARYAYAQVIALREMKGCLEKEGLRHRKMRRRWLERGFGTPGMSWHEMRFHLDGIAGRELYGNALDWSLEEELERRERIEALKVALKMLSDEDRWILHAVFVEDRMFCEVATELGISRAWFSRKLTRLLGRLRQEIMRRDGSWEAAA